VLSNGGEINNLEEEAISEILVAGTHSCQKNPPPSFKVGLMILYVQV
jgi:hypothetical protein